MTIDQYVEMNLRYCRIAPVASFMTNTYGAVCYETLRNPSDAARVEDLWTNVWKPAFEEIIY